MSYDVVAWKWASGQGARIDAPVVYDALCADRPHEAAAAIDADAVARGVEQDKRKAFSWYARAAAQGNREGLFNVAGCYRNGEGVDRDTVKAAEVYQRLADAGDEDAAEALAEMCEKGEGVPKDPARAAALYRQAEAAGSATARRALQRLGNDK